jgi:RNA polymerase sigma factor (TIGR02999 family)
VSTAGDVTELLSAAERGEAHAVARLYELLYPELRTIARARLRESQGSVSVQTTALVHESFLRMSRLNRLGLNDRSHFFAYASRVMRSVIVDLVREARSERRGGDHQFVTIDTAASGTTTRPDDEILRVHEALQELALLDGRLVQLVEMRYFVGMEMADIAEALGVTRRTAQRDWNRARAFLFASLKKE